MYSVINIHILKFILQQITHVTDKTCAFRYLSLFSTPEGLMSCHTVQSLTPVQPTALTPLLMPPCHVMALSAHLLICLSMCDQRPQDILGAMSR